MLSPWGGGYRMGGAWRLWLRATQQPVARTPKAPAVMVGTWASGGAMPQTDAGWPVRNYSGCGDSGRGGEASRGFGVVAPRHPGGGVQGHRGRMAQQRHQVVERFHPVEFGGVDQAHEEVPDLGAVEGAIEQGVLAMEDGLLQAPTAQRRYVQRCAGHRQEAGEFLPVVLPVGSGLAEPGVVPPDVP